MTAHHRPGRHLKFFPNVTTSASGPDFILRSVSRHCPDSKHNIRALQCKQCTTNVCLLLQCGAIRPSDQHVDLNRCHEHSPEIRTSSDSWYGLPFKRNVMLMFLLPTFKRQTNEGITNRTPIWQLIFTFLTVCFAFSLPDGNLYAVGGYDSSSHLATVEKYDPQVNKWAVWAAVRETALPPGSIKSNLISSDRQ